ncbi:MAG: hypothetical protein R3E79_05025 [Caldilineaceae bacterium]
MITLGTLAITGGALYGGVKALRFWQRRERPLWLKEIPLVGATVAIEGSQTVGDAFTVDNTLFEAVDEHAATMITYVLHNKQGRKTAVITLTSTTALIHLLLGLQSGNPLFIWNGAGFVAFLAGQYFTPALASYRAEVRDSFIAYTGTTIVAYFLSTGSAGLLDR